MILAKAKSEGGSAFILALMVVAAVGLLVVPVIYLATTGLRSTNLAQHRFLERYAADAGVEEGIWLAIDNPPLPNFPFIGIESNFNDLTTTIDIKAVNFPTPMSPPIPVDDEPDPSGKNIIIRTTVKPNYVAPCDPDIPPDCDSTTFIYTVFIQNFGNGTLQIERFGVCLPATFEFVGMLHSFEEENEAGFLVWQDGVQNLIWWPNPYATVADLTELDVPILYVPASDPIKVGNGMSQPIVEPPRPDPADLDPPCGPNREQVSWNFRPPAPGWITVENGQLAVARVSFEATAILGLENKHYSRAWIQLNSTSDPITPGETSPVVVKYAEYDIRSTAGGTTVEARASVNGDTDESKILSWQVE